MGSFQKILKPTRARGLDTSGGEQIVGNQLLGDPSFDTNVNNGDTGTYWNCNDSNNEGVSISSGKAHWADDGSASTRRLKEVPSGPFDDVTARYRVTITISDYTDGGVRLVSGAYYGTYLTAAGTYVLDMSPQTGSGNLHIDGNADAHLSISDVTVYKLESFGNNNHAQIYSGRALEFDGVTDYLNVGTSAGQIFIDYSEETTAVNRAWTVAVWLNYDAAGSSNQSITGFDNSRDVSTSNYLRLSNTETLGFYDIGGNASRTGDTVLKPKTWYRAVFVYNGSDTVNFYLNGVADGSGTLTSSNADNNADLNISYIGGAFQSSVFGNAFAGKMSNFQAWQGAWTADDAMYDYLNPEQLALNRGGTSLTNSNLKLWYPMNEGHRGDQSYVLDASNTGLGDDIVNWSSTFNASGTSTDDFGSWTTNANDSTTFCTFDHDNKTIRLRTTNSTHLQAFYVPEILKYGTTYKFEFTVSEITSGSVRVRPQNTTDYLTVSEAGTHSYIVSPEHSTNDLDFRIERGSSEATDVTINDVKIFPINDKNSAQTVFYGDNTISTNNDYTMSGSNNWDAYGTGTTESVTGGKLRVTTTTANTTQGVELPVANAGTPVVGRTYRIRAKLKRVSGLDPAEQIVFYFGGAQGNITTVGGGGTTNRITDSEVEYETTVTATSASGNLLIVNWSTTTALVFEIDDVEIKEAGIASGWTDADQQLDIPQTALQSYNQLGFSYGSADTAGGTISCGAITSGAWTTLDIWFFPQVSGYNQGLLDQVAWNGDDADASTGGYGFRVTISTTDKIVLTRRVSGTSASNAMTSTNKINIGKWNHVAVVIPKNDSTSMRLMVNGHYEQTNSSGDHGITAKDFRLGYGGGINYDSMPGCIAQASYFKEHMSETQMLELYNEGTPIDSRNHSVGTDNLAGYWRNNGVYGNTWTNLANPGTNDGTPQSLITETMLITAGVDSSRDSQGFLMNSQRLTNTINGLYTGSSGGGTYNSGAVVQDSSTLDITGAFTIGCWVKLKDFNYSYNLIQKKTGWNSAGYGIYIHNSNKKPYLEWGGSGANQQASGDNNDIDTLDIWYFVYGVHDPDGLHNSGTGIDRLYSAKTTDTSLNINGKTSMHAGNIDDAVATNDLPLTIGNHYGGGQVSSASIHFTGEIDDVVVYNGALSPEQVLRNFKAGKRSHK